MQEKIQLPPVFIKRRPLVFRARRSEPNLLQDSSKKNESLKHATDDSLDILPLKGKNRNPEEISNLSTMRKLLEEKRAQTDDPKDLFRPTTAGKKAGKFSIEDRHQSIFPMKKWEVPQTGGFKFNIIFKKKGKSSNNKNKRD